jgi:hypothetical protein
MLPDIRETVLILIREEYDCERVRTGITSVQ